MEVVGPEDEVEADFLSPNCLVDQHFRLVGLVTGKPSEFHRRSIEEAHRLPPTADRSQPNTVGGRRWAVDSKKDRAMQQWQKYLAEVFGTFILVLIDLREVKDAAIST